MLRQRIMQHMEDNPQAIYCATHLNSLVHRSAAEGKLVTTYVTLDDMFTKGQVGKSGERGRYLYHHSNLVVSKRDARKENLRLIEDVINGSNGIASKAIAKKLWLSETLVKTLVFNLISLGKAQESDGMFFSTTLNRDYCEKKIMELFLRQILGYEAGASLPDNLTLGQLHRKTTLNVHLVKQAIDSLMLQSRVAKKSKSHYGFSLYELLCYRAGI